MYGKYIRLIDTFALLKARGYKGKVFYESNIVCQ